MFGNLLRQVELRHLTSFVSPAFFEVFPRKTLWIEGRRIVSNQRNQYAFDQCRAARQAELDQAGLPVRVWPPRPASVGVPGSKQLPLEAQRAFAHAVVTLYFHQLFAGHTLLLDQSARALTPADVDVSPGAICPLDWHPSAWFVEWEPEFRSALQLLYRGFYVGDDAAFDAGASRLGLSAIKHLFRQHFGEQTNNTRFRLKHFYDSFQRIFEYCKTHRIELKGEFVVLGACLSTLYENLDRFDVAVDARSCFILGARGYVSEQDDVGRAVGANKVNT